MLNMKKILIILIAVISIAIIAFLGWYFILRDSSIPVGATLRNVLPFGSGDNTPQSTTNNPQPTTDIGDQQTMTTPNMFNISDIPVAGAVVFEKEGQTVVRYVDRATGHIYEADLKTLAKTKITNQTLPKIYEAYFRADGNAVLLRSLKDNSDVVENLSLALTPPQGTSTDALYAVSSTALRGDISAVAVGSGNALFYALRDTTSIITSAFNG